MTEFATITIHSVLAPVSVVLQPLEYEANYPSFRCRATCVIEHPTGRLTYEASDVWFSTEQFDCFLLELSGITRGSHEQARLHDLSDCVVLTFIQNGRKTGVSLDIVERSPDSAEARLSFASDVGAEFPAAILNQLKEYDRWWKHAG